MARKMGKGDKQFDDVGKSETKKDTIEGVGRMKNSTRKMPGQTT